MLNLKQYRTQLGLSQADVAATLSISRAAYTNIENGKRDPDTSTLLALADLFHVSLDDLMGRARPDVPTLSMDEGKLLALFNQCTAEGRGLILDYAAMIAAKAAYQKEPVSGSLNNLKEA